MYRNTRFGELMKGLPRGQFEKVVNQHQADKYAKGFRCWDQLIAMVYAQLSGCKSLREVETSFNSQSVHHYHLGSRVLKRSTLADANAKRHSDVFAAVCSQLLTQAHCKVKREIKDLLYFIDSTPIPLKGLGYDDWAKSTRNDRTQGLKVHMVLAGDTPVQVDMSEPNINDIEIGREMPLESGATYVFDKGYCDYNWWYKMTQAGAYFVTRLKKNAGVKVTKVRDIPRDQKDRILEDAVIQFKNKHPGGKRINRHYGTPLRRVTVARSDKPTPIVLITNDFTRSAQEIAVLYKQRWGIELFFKWLKQNLKIKQFLGRSENAVKIQIYTALITYLLVHGYRLRQGIAQSLRLCVIELRATLFQRPEIEQVVIQTRRRWLREQQKLQGVLAL